MATVLLEKISFSYYSFIATNCDLTTVWQSGGTLLALGRREQTYCGTFLKIPVSGLNSERFANRWATPGINLAALAA